MLFSIGIAVFCLMLVIGVPIWLTLGLTGAYWAIVVVDLPLSMFSTQIFSAMDSWVLLAIPYFLLAGNLMTFLGPANTLLEFITDTIGRFRGGVPAAGVIGCAVFGALSGSSIATAVTIGTLIVPKMEAMGYSRSNSLGLIAASGTLGSLIPPSIVLILYGSLSMESITDLFLAGIIPGILISVALVFTAVFVSNREIKTVKLETKSKADLKRSALRALPPALMPFIVLGGIYTGIFTPTESAAVSVVYVLIISFVFNRDTFTADNIGKSLKSTLVTTSVIFILLGGTQLFSSALLYTQAPQQLSGYVADLTFAPWIIMMFILALYFILGTFLEPLPILFITMPVLFPIVLDLGYDPIHFGIVTCVLMMLSQITPPVGGTLFALSGQFKENIIVISKGAMPYIFTLVVMALILLFFPSLSLLLVR